MHWNFCINKKCTNKSHLCFIIEVSYVTNNVNSNWINKKDQKLQKSKYLLFNNDIRIINSITNNFGWLPGYNYCILFIKNKWQNLQLYTVWMKLKSFCVWALQLNICLNTISIFLNEFSQLTMRYVFFFIDYFFNFTTSLLLCLSLTRNARQFYYFPLDLTSLFWRSLCFLTARSNSWHAAPHGRSRARSTSPTEGYQQHECDHADLHDRDRDFLHLHFDEGTNESLPFVYFFLYLWGFLAVAV